MDDLVAESVQEGFRFVSRLREEWVSGVNRFAGKGEALFAGFDADQLVAVGGINRQSADCGRLRRVYVRKADRRRGLGGQLVRHIMNFAAQHYRRVVLRTDTEAAEHFYVALGFIRQAGDGGSTHAFEIGRQSLKSL